MMFLEKSTLVKGVQEIQYEEACYDGRQPDGIRNCDTLHDICLNIEIQGVRIEDDPILYRKMCWIIDRDWEEIAAEVNDFMDEECCPSYMGEPAFSSASDYYSYRFG